MSCNLLKNLSEYPLPTELKNISIGFQTKVDLSKGQYTWWHNQGLYTTVIVMSTRPLFLLLILQLTAVFVWEGEGPAGWAMVLWSASLQLLYIIEFTLPWKDAVKETYKKLRSATAQECGWEANVRPGVGRLRPTIKRGGSLQSCLKGKPVALV